MGAKPYEEEKELVKFLMDYSKMGYRQDVLKIVEECIVSKGCSLCKSLMDGGFTSYIDGPNLVCKVRTQVA